MKRIEDHAKDAILRWLANPLCNCADPNRPTSDDFLSAIRLAIDDCADCIRTLQDQLRRVEELVIAAELWCAANDICRDKRNPHFADVRRSWQRLVRDEFLGAGRSAYLLLQNANITYFNLEDGRNHRD
jgi:hypothetical protein